MNEIHRNDNDLRWRLRQLPREREPGRDLWPALAERLAQSPQAAARPASGPHRLRFAVSAALAAGVTLTVALGWLMTDTAPEPAAQVVAAATLRQAEAIRVEYEAALAQFEGAPVPTTVQPALQELDRSAEQIRMALAADPQSRFLLDRLRRTYERRLGLLQHGLLG